MKKIALLLTIFLISIPLVKTVQAVGIEDVRRGHRAGRHALSVYENFKEHIQI